MAHIPCLFHAVLAASFLVLTLQRPRSAAQPEGFQSINCGGKAYTDPSTRITWEEDPLNEIDNQMSLFGRDGKVDSQFQNTTQVMTSLRYFPEAKRNRKSCYVLPVSNGSTYLLRASFLYGNYDGLDHPPSFALLLNYGYWTDVTTSSSAIPIVYELTFLSKEDDCTICLAPHINSNETPFISTLELRQLNKTMYSSLTGGALFEGYGLMLWHRICYGARTSSPIRYPNDPYDRIWEANTTGPIAGTDVSNGSSIFYGEDLERPPPEVMARAIATQNSKSNLSFTFEGFGGTAGFRVEMHWQEVDEEAVSRDGPRHLGLTFPHSALQSSLGGPVFWPFWPSSSAPISFAIDQELQLPLPLQITVFPYADSPRGPLLNAIELFRWTPQPLPATGTFQGDVDAINQIKENFKLMGYGQGDPCVSSGYSWTWIVCNKDEEAKIVEIHLASFNLTGDIPSSINDLEYLQIIDLSNNMLTGEIPNLTRLMHLEYLDLHNNKIDGELPKSLLQLPKLATLNVDHNDLCGITSAFETLENFSYIGNPTECHCLSSSQSTNLAEKMTKRMKYIYPISCLGSWIIGSVSTYLLLYITRQSRTKKQKLTKGANDLQDLPFTTKMFTYNEICNATQHFSTLLGKGGFGEVYYGMLACGKAIAVKMLVDASKQGLKQFSTEVAILSSSRHKNLVCLIGYCMENTHMLVYEYVSKGNLRDLMYGEVQSLDKPLPWVTRLQIAIDASQGLEYLHTGCDPAIIHRDVKSSNILLTDKLQAKVADFGLSRLKEGGSSVSHVSTMNVVGTAGYFDPAYVATNQLTDKSDVYSFGIVLFELISGRAPIDYFSGPSHIVDWVTLAIEQGKVEDIVDPTLKHGYKVESLQKVVDTAIGCVENDRIKRPNIRQVVDSLKEALEIEVESPESPLSKDMSGSSSQSNGELPTLQYIESL